MTNGTDAYAISSSGPRRQVRGHQGSAWSPAVIRATANRAIGRACVTGSPRAISHRQRAVTWSTPSTRSTSAAVTVVEMASALSTTRRVVDPAEHRETTRVSNLLLSWRRPPTRPTVDTVSITDKGRAVAERKPLLIRVDPAVHDALARWAADELRSTTAQIELVLRRALADAGRLPSNVKAMPRRGRPRKQEPLEPSVSPVPTLAAASFGEPGPSSPQRRANARASVVSPS